MQITACLIVRNESAHLEKCLNSIKGVDEIVIVDTGSKDNTVEIAKKYTDKVYEFYDCNEPKTKEGLFMDFSMPRNFCASKASNDWVISIDADETLAPGGIMQIRHLLGKHPDKIGLLLTVNHLNHEKGQQIRVYNRTKTKWFDQAHNWLGLFTIDGVKPLSYFTDQLIQSKIEIKSDYSKNHDIDPDRTLRILSFMLSANPKHSRALFYMSREYLRRDNVFAAYYYLKKYINFAIDKTNELAEAYYALGCIETDLRDFEKAREYFFLSASILPTLKANYERLSEIHQSPLSTFFKKFAEVVDNQGAMFVKL